MSKVSVKQLFESGAHFGHQRGMSHPHAQDFVQTVVDKTLIINLDKTQAMLEEALTYLSKQVQEGKSVLIVGTKLQARKTVERIAKDLGIAYVVNKWLGGTLTNFETIKASLKKLEEYDETVQTKEYESMPKKAKAMFSAKHKRLKNNLEGLKSLEKAPDALIIVDTKRENTAVVEARKVHIPIVGLVDTNADPYIIDYPIIINDDSTKTINLVLDLVAETIKKSQKVHALSDKKVSEQKNVD